MKKLFTTLVMLMTLNVNAQWVQVWNGMGQTRNIGSLFSNNSLLIAGCFYNDWGIYTSTNEGLTWNTTSLTNKQVFDFTSVNSSIYACAENGIYVSSNGIDWSNFTFSNLFWIWSFAVNNNFMFVGTQYNGVYFSSNNGQNWTQSYLNNKTIYSLAVLNNYVIAGTDYNGIYYSTDNGYIWNQSHISNLSIKRIKFNGNIVFAGTDNGIYKSTNFGVNWTQFGLPGKTINDFIINGQYIYAGTELNGIYVSTLQGLTWYQINEGFPAGNFYSKSLAFTNNYFITGSYGKSVWRRSKSEVGVKQISEIVPYYKLNQNYPNPFNPMTEIKFSISKHGHVILTVFNSIGRELETLVNEKLSSGTYETAWDGSKYSSGIYFYRLQAGEYSETKRMTLIK